MQDGESARESARPAYSTINDWIKMSGVGRTRTFELIGNGKLRAVKLGSRTLVHVDSGLAFLDGLPPAGRA